MKIPFFNRVSLSPVGSFSLFFSYFPRAMCTFKKPSERALDPVFQTSLLPLTFDEERLFQRFPSYFKHSSITGKFTHDSFFKAPYRLDRCKIA